MAIADSKLSFAEHQLGKYLVHILHAPAQSCPPLSKRCN